MSLALLILIVAICATIALGGQAIIAMVIRDREDNQ